MLICKEILESLAADDEDRLAYETFWMSIYCFPDPKDPKQLEIIRALGFVDNVTQDIRIESPD